MKEAFNLFDTEGDEKISPSELGILMKSLGGNPTQAQLKSIIVEDLRQILTNIEEKLEPDEFDEWIREVDVGSDGNIRYEDFIARMEEP